MSKDIDRTAMRKQRHRRVRRKVRGTAERPRLSVYRSLHHMYAQLIDDMGGRTVASASTVEIGSPGKNLASAVAVGKAIAERAQKAGVDKVIFDRGGFLYHGKIRALAEAVREAGVKF